MGEYSVENELRNELIAEIVHNRLRAYKNHEVGKGGRIRPVDGWDIMTLFTFSTEDLEQTAKLTRQLDLDFDFISDVLRVWKDNQKAV